MSPPPMNLYVRLSIGPVRQEDVDALLRAMDAPLTKGESQRARAEMLRRLVDDSVIGALRGSDGRQLAVTATQALRSLDGSLPESLPRVPARAAPTRPSLEARLPSAPPTWIFVFGVLGLLWGVCEVLTALMYLARGSNDSLLGWCALADTAITLFLPGFVLLQADNTSSRGFLVVVLLLVVLAIPASLFLALVCVLADGGRAPHLGDLSTVVFIGSPARFVLLISLSAVIGRSQGRAPASVRSRG